MENGCIHRQDDGPDIEQSGFHVILHFFGSIFVQTDGHIRVAAVKFTDDCGEEACPHHRRQPDADMPLLQIAQTVQLRRQARERFHNILCFGQQNLSGICQPDAFSFTVKEIGPQLNL
ncbi:hypothetical protein D3C75_843880 [compost metagenome]